MELTLHRSHRIELINGLAQIRISQSGETSGVHQRQPYVNHNSDQCDIMRTIDLARRSMAQIKSQYRNAITEREDLPEA